MHQGGFVWYELTTGDVEGAIAFYAAVTGWTMTDSEMPGVRYTLAKVGDRQVAGVMAAADIDAEAPKMWSGYIAVDDVDAMAVRVRDAGGTVYREPMDIPGVGRFAVVADPQGAMFMLFRGAGDPAPDLPPHTPGGIGWHELHTSDQAAAFGFYESLFGWEKSYAHDMGEWGIYQTFSVGGTWTGGMMSDAQAPQPYWLYYVTVADVDAAAARIAEHGGRVLSGPHDVPGGSRVLSATDPQGVMFALTSVPRG